MSEEQRAAASVAAKKTKKLRQKANRQQAAVDSSDADSLAPGPLQHSPETSLHLGSASSAQAPIISVGAASPLVNSTAGSMPGSTVQSPTLPGAITQHETGHGQEQLRKQRSPCANEPLLNDDDFLRELFSCPITKVSESDVQTEL